MRKVSKEEILLNKEYLLLLREKYPNIQCACAKIINLKSILNLPKGTEHFITDIHGEYEAFQHVLRNCSGSIRRKAIEVLKDDLQKEELERLITLIYYPKKKLSLLKEENITDDLWYKNTIKNLLKLCSVISLKYTRKKVRQALHENYRDIIEELLYKDNNNNRDFYYDGIIDAIVEIKASDDFIIELCNSICRLNLDHLHIIGDIYDRGRGPHYVLDTLQNYHSLDIQWGNHDVLWMGAAAGNEACIANAVRICLRYGNTSILEDGYGINLLPLTFLAQNTYKSNCDLQNFMPKISDEYPDIDELLMAKMQKAISIIQFKLESRIIKNHPNYLMDDRDLINKCDFNNFTITLNKKTYPLNTKDFPTIDPNDPTKLTKDEEKVIKALKSSFMTSSKLQEHTHFLFKKGSIYTVYNDNLLLHASIPMNEDGTFREILIEGEYLKGQALLDKMDEKIRNAYYDKHTDASFFWFLWCAPISPLFGKDKMASFERYFIDDSQTHKEKYLPYYTKVKEEKCASYVLAEFSLHNEDSKIINGHIPVKMKDGQSPINANGKLLLIDGGYSKAYQKVTGVAGVTLTFNSYGMNLIMHEPFRSIEEAIINGKDIKSEQRFISSNKERIIIYNTDIGQSIKKEIYYLELLLSAYRVGEIKIIE